MTSVFFNLHSTSNIAVFKPIKISELKILLDKIKNDIFKTQKTAEREILRSYMLLEKKPGENDLLLPYQNYMISLVCFGNCLDHCGESPCIIDPSEHIDKISDPLKQICSEKDHNWFYRTNPYNELIILTAFQQTVPKEAGQLSNILLSSIDSLDLPVTVFSSIQITDSSSLGVTYRQLRRDLYNQIIFSKPRAFSQMADTAKNICEIPISSEKKIICYLKHSQKKQFFSEFHQLLKHFEHSCCTQYQLQQNILRIAYLCKTYAMAGTEFDPDTASYIIDTIAISKDYTVLEYNLTQFFRYYFEQNTCSNKFQARKETVKAIQNYVDEHYCEQVSLNDISEFLNLQPTYLSKVFKNAIGQTPIQYLSYLRIEKAKELPKNPENRIKDIADMCGYSDQFYFSKVFKDSTGIPPTKYQALYSQ